MGWIKGAQRVVAPRKSQERQRRIAGGMSVPFTESGSRFVQGQPPCRSQIAVAPGTSTSRGFPSLEAFGRCPRAPGIASDGAVIRKPAHALPPEHVSATTDVPQIAANLLHG